MICFLFFLFFSPSCIVWILCFYFVLWIFIIFLYCAYIKYFLNFDKFFYKINGSNGYCFFFLFFPSIDQIVSKWSKLLWFDHVDYLWGIMDLNRAGLEPDWWIILAKLLGIRYNNFYEIIINNAIICIMWYDIDIIYDNELIIIDSRDWLTSS